MNERNVIYDVPSAMLEISRMELGNYFKRYDGRGIPEEVPPLNRTFCHRKQFTCSAERLTCEIMFIALCVTMVINSAHKCNRESSPAAQAACFLQNAFSTCPVTFRFSRVPTIFVTFPDAFGSRAVRLPWKMSVSVIGHIVS